MASEEHLLEALLAGRRSLPSDHVGPGDDACVLPAAVLAGEQLVLSTDAQEEDVHFRAAWLDLEDLAHRTLASALSDLAAMGARPLGYLLSVAWPTELGKDELSRFAAGLRLAEDTLGCAILGGDTDVRSGPLRLEATVVGASPCPLLRSHGRAGAELYVSGPLGAAAAIVRRRLSGTAAPESDSAWADADQLFKRPTPRLKLGLALSRAAAQTGSQPAVIDLSDGLRPDLSKLAAASGLSATLESEELPVHPAAASLPCGTELALDGGEDYELLIACSRELFEELERSAPDEASRLVRVGRLEAGVSGKVTLARRRVACPEAP